MLCAVQRKGVQLRQLGRLNIELIEARLNRGWSPNQLAERAGISGNTLQTKPGVTQFQQTYTISVQSSDQAFPAASITRVSVSCGRLPLIMYKKLPARLNAGSGATGS
jgi:hypothetical protein